MGSEQPLLLAALVVLASCQQNPKVAIFPNLLQVYSGDFFYLSCVSSTSGAVKWFFEDQEQPHQTDKLWRIAAAHLEHSGFYHCAVNSLPSEKVVVNVLGFMPKASLEINTGQPVMRPGSSVTLQIENEDGLQGWLCWVYKGGKTRRIKLRLSNDTVHLPFTPSRLTDPENIYWCTEKDLQQRSNQVIVLTSVKPVSLEMNPFPALAGESVTLQCLVWGTDQISHARFYVNASDLQRDGRPSYEIQHVTNSAKGSYRCHASFTYSANSDGPLRETSDDQVLEVYEIQMRAVLSEGGGKLSCFCPKCQDRLKSFQYRWYNHDTRSGRWSLMVKDSSEFMLPEKTGAYSCRAVWDNGRSLLSKSYMHNHSSNPTILIVIIVITLLVALLVLAGAVRCHQQRQGRDAIYEDMPLQSQGKQYEPLLRPHGSQPEAEYETLQAGAAGQKKNEGGYEALKKEEGKHEIYHSLQMEGTGSGTKEYEQLRQEGRKPEVYHTLQMQGAESGDN